MSRFLSFLFLLGSISALSAQSVTFSEHIAPIVYSHCAKCHRPGQIAPFSLMSYSDVRRHALTVGAVTQSRYMPPWKAEPGWAAYRDERRLSPEQIALIQQWIAQGLPEGDPAKAPRLPTFSDDWQLGTPDLILEMPTAFAVPADGNDIYRNFVLPTSLTEDKWVRAIELKPSARGVVHHALLFSDTTGTGRAMDALDQTPGFPGFGSVFTVDLVGALNGGLGGWVPGSTPFFQPEGIAVPLPKGSDVLLQTHFHPNGIAQMEKTAIGLYFGKKPDRPITQVQAPAFFGVRANIDIPAGVKDYKLRGSFTLPVDVDAVTVTAHMHYLGKEARLTVTLPTGEVKVLLWIRQWDINWQDQYTFKDLLFLPQGTRIDGELTYDNSADNPRNPSSPPKRVRWGEFSTDEMGSLLMTVVPRRQEDITPLLQATLSSILTAVPPVGDRPLFVSSGLVDGASTQPGAVTPGKIVVLYGSRIGPATFMDAQYGSDGRLATNLGGTQVLFDGTPAQLLYASSGQLAAVVPSQIDGKLGAQVQVLTSAGNSDFVALPVTPVAPSIFSMNQTGAGQGAILNQDGVTVNSSAHPAARGSVVAIYATGEGRTLANLSVPSRPVRVWMNGRPVEVQYAGVGPGPGLFQVNAKIPDDAPPGDLSLEIQVGDARSQPGITIAVR